MTVQGFVTQEIIDYPYAGSGIEEDTNLAEAKHEAADSHESVRDRASISSQSTLEWVETVYEASPYDIDHVHTHNSAITQTARRAKSRWNIFGFGPK